MYIKLALCNVKRSIFDYMLYIITMIVLISVLCVSNFIAIYGNIRAGFQTVALPFLIVLIMIVLVNYINLFMIKQRAGEFANYLLLGMEKYKLTYMFLLEFFIIGSLCFILGEMIGTVVFIAVLSSSPQHIKNLSGFIEKNTMQTFFFYIVVEIISAFCMREKIYKLQISELMKEKNRNQPMRKEKKRYWGFAFIISISVLFLFLLGIVYLPESMEFMIISFISIPLLSCVFTFYQWIYAYLSSRRLSQPEMLWQNNRLYHIAEITMVTRTSSIMSAVFCICLLFALTSFVFGTLLLNDEPKIFMSSTQRFMGLLQISICIIFLTIYFSILSFQQIIDIKRQAKNIRILSYMGKNQAEIRSLLKTQIMIKLLLPTLMCLVLLIAAPFINLKLNMELSGTISNLFMKAVGEFLVCFIILYFVYFQMVYRISNRYIKRLWTRDHIFGN